MKNYIERRSLVRNIDEEFIFSKPAVHIKIKNQHFIYKLIKRLFDVIISYLGLLILTPLFLVIIVLIKINSKGPVLFVQERIGLGGTKFKMYKFRTMIINAEELKEQLMNNNEMTGPVFKIKDDPRITKIGKNLRKFSLDELPQLFNVFIGDMTLVGPRPALEKEVKKYKKWQLKRLETKPGITCIWQVSGRNKIGFEDWMRLDIRYMQKQNFLLDLKLLIKTINAVITADGAY